MSRLRLLIGPFAVLAFLLIVAATAQVPRGTAPAGPMLWNAHMGSGFYPPPPVLRVASFTPSGEIILTRIEVDIVQGPYAFRYPASAVRCAVTQSLQLTNGNVTYTQPLSHPQDLPQDLSSRTDSGPLSVKFPANSRIDLLLLAGSPDCDIVNVNIAVQYKTL